MSVIDCSCGELHEVVYSYIKGVGDYRYRCPKWGGDIRPLLRDAKTRTVTLGLEKDPQ